MSRQKERRIWHQRQEAEVEAARVAMADALSARNARWEEELMTRQDAIRALATYLAKGNPPLDDYEALVKSDIVTVTKSRVKALSHGFKHTEVNVDPDWVLKRATGDAIEAQVTQETTRVTQEWADAEEVIQAELLRDKNDARALEIIRVEKTRQRSAYAIQQAYKMHVAGRVLKMLAMRAYAKEMDPSTQQPLYLNTRTGTQSYVKPRSLGSEDLPFTDKWFLITSPGSSKPYYFNPRHIRQSWHFPVTCVPCSDCARRFADGVVRETGVATCALCRASNKGTLQPWDGALEGSLEKLRQWRHEHPMEEEDTREVYEYFEDL